MRSFVPPALEDLVEGWCVRDALTGMNGLFTS